MKLKNIDDLLPSLPVEYIVERHVIDNIGEKELEIDTNKLRKMLINAFGITTNNMEIFTITEAIASEFPVRVKK